jgi:transcriptional regulator with XRE-family HTH domain
VLPEEIKALRRDLKLTVRALADAVRVDVKDVLAWESGERFPTKRSVTGMRSLRARAEATGGEPRAPHAAEKGAAEKGAAEKGAAEKGAAEKGAAAGGPFHPLAEPSFWRVVRKLLAHPELFREVEKLAEGHADPAERGAQR